MTSQNVGTCPIAFRIFLFTVSGCGYKMVSVVVAQNCEWLTINAFDAGLELFSVRDKNCSETVL